MNNRETQMLEEKYDMIKKIESHYSKWDGSTDQAMALLKRNQEFFRKIKAIDGQLSKHLIEQFNHDYQINWKDIIHQHKTIMKTIQEESNDLEESMKQMNKKSQFVDHYIDKERSLFVNKDA